MAALEQDYAAFILLNGGEHCGVCGRRPSASRKLDRDHAHTVPPVARGLLCNRCNRALPSWVTVEWLRAAIRYLERSAGDVDATQD